MDKAVVLAAGKGTRLSPVTKAVPKEIVRVGKKPTIEHVLRVLKAGRIDEVMVVVGRKKHAIMDYLGSGERLGMDIYYRMQEEPKGTAHAVSLASGFVRKGEDFAVMYGDNYISPYSEMEEIVGFHERNGSNTVVLHEVDDPRRYGVVKLDKDNRVEGMIEKPSLEEAQPYKRNGHWLNIAGLMILDSGVFDYIEKIEPGEGGELWLTDAVERMRRDRNDVYGYIFEGNRYDIGTFESLKEADEQARRDENHH